MTGPIAPFDLTGPLPSGTTVLEASAGTGKTFTIAGLVTRWVAETELRLPDLLVVTFTRAATAELRDRVRRRIVSTAEHLEQAIDGRAAPTDDPVLTVLQNAPPDVLELRRERLARALTDIDVATISTIHGFCQHVLDGLGIASDLDRHADLVEDVRDLVEEVVDDLLVSTYLEHGDRPRVHRDQLLALGRVVAANPTTALAPTNADEGSAAGLRLHLAERIRAEVDRRARRRRQLSYDDLLTRLDATLRDPDRGAAARAALRERYRVALIDEFQDTDPVQWSIVSQTFVEDADPDRSLVLIGDPKQAIYAFRGADVFAYLDAARQATTRHTLGTSWRADRGLLTAYDALFDGATFGDAGIPYRRVDAAPGHEVARLIGGPSDAALRLRVVPRHPSLPQWKGKPNADRVRDLIARDVAADVVALLDARPDLVDRDHDGREIERRPLAPRDLAVLVRTNDQAARVQDALRAVNVPAVLGGVDSVFATPAATDWRRLLDALERPASGARVRALALTAWIGWTADRVARAPEADWDRLHDDVHQWARLLRERGVAAMHRAVLLQREVQPRLLAQDAGERRLADLEHVAELLHAATTAEHLGTTALAGWLRDRIADAADEQQDDRLRRLETDSEAVQILTIHRSKGLEFPVVYCPFLWSSNTAVREDVPVFHDDGGRRRIDVGGKGHPGFEDTRARAEDEARGEELRLLYVAMTRARHQVVAWYAPAGMPGWSGLGRMLLCRGADGRAEPDREAPLPDDDRALAACRAVADRAAGTVDVETVPETPSARTWTPDSHPAVDLQRSRFERTLDDSWRRTSYSALTRVDDDVPHVTSEPDQAVKDDEAAAVPVEVAVHTGEDPHGLRDIALALGDMPGGTHVGTFVHRVLEHTDFAAVDLDADLAHAVDEARARARVDVDPSVVTAGLRAVVHTTLGPAASGLRLRDVTRSDRRDEVEFELPLDRGGRAATVADIARLLHDHLPADDPLAGYPGRLPRALLDRDLRGFLGGSIDLVLRRDGGAGPVFHVADYKTNRLGVWGEPLTAWDYRPEALAEAMMHGHYPIQALLYSVALHRMLRWRLPGYDPATHLGDVLYLFVRGMVGADTPTPEGRPCGVFAWPLPAPLVVATSDRLHGTVPA